MDCIEFYHFLSLHLFCLFMLGDKPRELEVECTFSLHVKKLHSTKTVAICEMSSKLNRTADKVDEAPLPNGHALKRHNEENGGNLQHQDYQQKSVSNKLVLSKECAHEKPSLPLDPNEPAARKSNSNTPGGHEVADSQGREPLLARSSPVRNNVYISPTDVTAPCKSVVLGQVVSLVSKEPSPCKDTWDESCVAKGFDASKQFVKESFDSAPKYDAAHLRTGSLEFAAVKSNPDPFAGAGIDSQIIMSLAAAARSSCMPSVETETNDDDIQASFASSSHLQVMSNHS